MDSRESGRGRSNGKNRAGWDPTRKPTANATSNRPDPQTDCASAREYLVSG